MEGLPVIVHNPESRRESAVKEVFYMYSTMCHVVSSCPTAPFCTFMNGRLTSRFRPGVGIQRPRCWHRSGSFLHQLCGLADSRRGAGGTLERPQDDLCDHDRVGIDDGDDGAGAHSHATLPGTLCAGGSGGRIFPRVIARKHPIFGDKPHYANNTLRQPCRAGTVGVNGCLHHSRG
jgi:hypothetical protein